MFRHGATLDTAVGWMRFSAGSGGRVHKEAVAELARFVLGLDLDGTCADFYGRMREIAAEWTGRPVDELVADPDWGLTSWGLLEGEYERLHRFAVTQRDLFESMKPIAGAPQALRRLGTEGVRVRIITHRLFIRHFHETAVAQTVRWLDHHGVPYWDLCFMRRKGDVGADLYVEDSPENVEDLRAAGKPVLILTNPASERMAAHRVQEPKQARQVRGSRDSSPTSRQNTGGSAEPATSPASTAAT